MRRWCWFFERRIFVCVSSSGLDEIVAGLSVVWEQVFEGTEALVGLYGAGGKLVSCLLCLKHDTRRRRVWSNELE
ncbi:hypothetical protein BGZ61DRAFT_458540 [Ilyonectria robusta]|uniref:uncharacterized protein n=1 Tax=Ilyonectria robusta TaxID=1079257 RepID=UPI001E8D76A0|nr:uncharacterized protein BGZ61DRAFT_458540 [Ilyonectria robusta]KAH8672937.1 hypothetical protein BGZ61DRAFT_458540 [Ilyonectria robusta]